MCVAGPARQSTEWVEDDVSEEERFSAVLMIRVSPIRGICRESGTIKQAMIILLPPRKDNISAESYQEEIEFTLHSFYGPVQSLGWTSHLIYRKLSRRNISFVVFLALNKIYYSLPSSKEVDNLSGNYSYLSLPGSAESSKCS